MQRLKGIIQLRKKSSQDVIGSGTRCDYREMKLSFLSELEAVSEARTVSGSLMVMSGIIACVQGLLLRNTQKKAQEQHDSHSNIQNKCESLPEKSHCRASYINGII